MTNAYTVIDKDGLLQRCKEGSKAHIVNVKMAELGQFTIDSLNRAQSARNGPSLQSHVRTMMPFLSVNGNAPKVASKPPSSKRAGMVDSLLECMQPGKTSITSEGNLVKRVFPAAQLLRVANCLPKGDVSFLNWKINAIPVAPLEDFTGPGLYGICYDRKLVYIGKFRNPVKNIIQVRWWAHFGTVTLRGHKVAIKPKIKSFLLSQYGSVLHPELRAGLASMSTKESGCMTSLNRVLWANANWVRFSSAMPDDLLEFFEYFYVRVPHEHTAFASSIDHLRAAVSKAEDEAKEQLRPIVNNETRWTGTLNGHHRDEAMSVVSAILTKHLD
jgi:hypothetical protein